ncbi:MAG: histidinol-phosphatase HisJ family protein [Lentisphaerae bacterium]|nr:histidinol-phosphatase HisJ family protein [Lentisphaerota bacterium]
MLKFTFPGPGAGVSYHNHSDMSDGAASLELMCRAAKAAGLREFGMSDHWVIPPDNSIDASSWRMKPDRLDEYIEKLLKLKKELDSENFTLLLGLEIDFFFENYREVLKNLESYPLDYTIGSVHYSGNFPIDHSITDWVDLSEEQKEKICSIYWKKLEGAAACGLYTFIGHLDLPKKFGMIDNSKYLPCAFKVLNAVAKTQGAIELNTAGWFKECNEQYPCSDILKEACSQKIPVVVNADAHHQDHVKRSFAEAAQILEKSGYPAR